MLISRAGRLDARGRGCRDFALYGAASSWRVKLTNKGTDARSIDLFASLLTGLGSLFEHQGKVVLTLANPHNEVAENYMDMKLPFPAKSLYDRVTTDDDSF